MSLAKLISSLFSSKKPTDFPSDPEALFFYCTFSMIGKLVIADGVISEEEVAAVDRFIDDAFAGNNKAASQAHTTFHQATEDEIEIEVHAARFFEAFGESLPARDLVVDMLVQVSVADSEFSMEEEALVVKVAKAFELEQSHFNRLKYRYTSVGGYNGNEAFYAMLGCSPENTDEEIQITYTELNTTFSPDHVIDSGVPAAFHTYLNYRHERLQQAYAVIMEERGKPLPRN